MLRPFFTFFPLSRSLFLKLCLVQWRTFRGSASTFPFKIKLAGITVISFNCNFFIQSLCIIGFGFQCELVITFVQPFVLLHSHSGKNFVMYFRDQVSNFPVCKEDSMAGSYV